MFLGPMDGVRKTRYQNDHRAAVHGVEFSNQFFLRKLEGFAVDSFLPIARVRAVTPPRVACRMIAHHDNCRVGGLGYLYGLIFVALWIGVRLWSAHRRYWRGIPFLLGIPVCLVPLWFLCENAIRLLPNNI